MSNETLRKEIQERLKAFGEKPLAAASIGLLDVLGYRSDRPIANLPMSAAKFAQDYDQEERLNPEQALLDEWRSIDLLFQITDEEVRNALQLQMAFDSREPYDDAIIESFLFAAIDLKQAHYTRQKLAAATRAVNRLFPMPVIVIFRHGQAITLSIIRRRLHKREESKDVLEKVTLIKDIRYADPLRAHIDILADLALPTLQAETGFHNFVGLHRAWEKALDSYALTKRFYQDVANWYFWAVTTVKFPPGDGQEDEETRHAVAVIRMITRLIFVWFIKEKGLVPGALFQRHTLQEMLTWNDPQQSSYYKAILQNLFFATLNTEMDRDKAGSRRFRDKPHARNAHYGVPSLYRYEALFTNPAAALRLFADIPFLNGGLFECLDRPEQDVRVDGFSDRSDSPLCVPDELFFSEERSIDLNDVFGTRNKQYKVRGLFNIFSRYKFTIEENTPIEEEIALDPELLGQVFENLLAAYNPETRTTARKQTGSFYTPRQIVDYMVDEALIAALGEKLPGARGEVEPRLRQLFAYTNEAHQFSPAEVDALIEAIDAIKILDLACGSGAFPMGILHKLVFILRKLDPNNNRWKAQQLARAQRDRELAEQMEDEKIRENAAREADARIEEIRRSFDQQDHELDYTRKLYLIENCIYGVDIQPIAVQIAKLRFFISLVADQRVDNAAPNRNVRALPNLETKFVAANSLLGITRPAEPAAPAAVTSASTEINQKVNELVDVFAQYNKVTGAALKAKWLGIGREVCAELNALLAHDASFTPLNADWLFPTAPDTQALRALLPGDQPQTEIATLPMRNPAIEQLEAELRRVRKSHFTAKTTQTKRKHREADARLRQQLSELLERDGWDHDTTVMLAHWDPYDQNRHAEFFDPEWMFGMTDGFDVVIGNPPYVRQEQLGALKPRLQAQYDCYTGTADLYVYFYERGLRLLREQGVLTYISPNKYFRAGYGAKLRGYLGSQTRIVQLTDFGDAPIFTAIAYPSIIVAQRTATADHQLRALTWPTGAPLEEFADTFRKSSFLIAQRELTADGWRLEIPSLRRLLEKLLETGKPLGSHFKGRVFRGVSTGLNEAFIVDRSTRDKLISQTPSSNHLIKPYLRGKDVERWQVEPQDLWLCYVSWDFIPEQHPSIFSHLMQFESQLRARPEVKAGRFPWYAMSRYASDYWQEFEKPKLISTKVSRRPTFAYDNTGYYLGNTSYLIALDEHLLYCLGVLNSRVFLYYANSIFVGKQGGWYEVQPTALESFPIPVNPSSKQLIDTVNRVLNLKAQDPTADVSALEAEIDQLVYRLYGLTAEEIQIVEGS